MDVAQPLCTRSLPRDFSMNPAVTLGRLLVHRGCATSMARSMGSSPAPWNYMWKPGRFPEDLDERKAAAKKYGMLLEDYSPYEDPDRMTGDYPCLPIEPAAEKNGLYEWDDPAYRRNYGEPLQEEWSMYQETRLTPNSYKRYSMGTMFACQAAAVTTIIFLWFLTNGEYGIPKLTQPVLDLQLVTDKETHYTFEVPE